MRLTSLAMTTTLIAATAIAAPTLALSHDVKVGANGGPLAHAGSYHVELVSQGTSIQVFLRDQGDKAVTTDGYKGVAIFAVGGKPQRIPLAPAGENKLMGTSAVELPKEPKGAVQITTPTGSTVQAKFN
jgi:hypothetical protein